jgi:hypothetical protein
MLMLRYLAGLLWLLLYSNIYEVQVNEQLELGRTGPDCAGRGICGFSRTPGGNGNTQVSYTSSDSLLKVSIIRARLTGDEMLKQFGTKNTKAVLPQTAVFSAEIDYLLPLQLKNDLYIPEGITRIGSGSYAIVQTSDLIIVSFKLQ